MTLYLLTERIFRAYSGGNPSDDSGLKFEDIRHMVVDQINLLLKTETITLNAKLGDEAPTGLMLATYAKVSTEVYNTVQSRAALPAIPISLPLNMGVWYVVPDADDLTVHEQFIPLQVGQWFLIKDFSPLVGSTGTILGNRTYTVDGKYLVFPTDITSAIPDLIIKLVISDISLMSDHDLLPLPADYADTVVKETLRMLGVIPQVEDVVNDSNSQK